MSFSPVGPLNLTDVSNDSCKHESFESSPKTSLSPSGKVSNRSQNENPNRVKIGRVKSLLSFFRRDNQKGSFPTPHVVRKSRSHVSINVWPLKSCVSEFVWYLTRVLLCAGIAQPPLWCRLSRQTLSHLHRHFFENHKTNQSMRDFKIFNRRRN